MTTTADHPFWNHTDQQWQPATSLDPGDHLLTHDNQLVTTAGIIDYTAHQDNTYNLTVAAIHTYYVFAGDFTILSHNAGSGCWRSYDAERIAQGHAERKHAGDFPGMTESDLVAHVEDVMSSPSKTKPLRDNRMAFLGKDGRTVVIHDPVNADGGTVFRPNDIDSYWETLE